MHADLAASPGGVADTQVPRALALLNPYAVLEVPRDAADEDIRRAWRGTSLVCHPDKVAQRRPAVEPAEAARLVARFHAAKHAYEAIGEPSARACYDAAVLRVQHGLRAAAFARRAVSQAVAVEALLTVDTRNATALSAADVRSKLLYSLALQPLLAGVAWHATHASSSSNMEELLLTVLFVTGALLALWLLVHTWTELLERTLTASLIGPSARYNVVRALFSRLEARLALSEPELDPDEAAALRTRRAAPRRAAPGSRTWQDDDDDSLYADMRSALITRSDGSFSTPPELPMRPRHVQRTVRDDGSVAYALKWRPQYNAQMYMLCTVAPDNTRRVLWQGRATAATLVMPPPPPGATRPEVALPRLIAINAAGESCASAPCQVKGLAPVASFIAARAPSPPRRSPEEADAAAAAARLRDEAHAARHSGRIHRVSAALDALRDVAAAAGTGEPKSVAIVACMSDFGRLVALLTAVKRDVEYELAMQRERARLHAEAEAAREAAAAAARPAAPPRAAMPKRRAPAPAAAPVAAAPAAAPAAAAPPQAEKPPPPPPPPPQKEAAEGLSRRQRQRQRLKGVPAEHPVAKPLLPPPAAPALQQPRTAPTPPQPAPQRAPRPLPRAPPVAPPLLPPPSYFPLVPPPAPPAPPPQPQQAEEALLVPPFFALPVPIAVPAPPAASHVVLPPYVPPPSAPLPPPPPQLPQPVPPASAAASAAASTERDDKHLCVACFESERDAVLLPCKHLCLCSPCVAVMAAFYQRSPAAAEAGAAALFHCPLCTAAVLDVLTGLYT
jgi:hypothetical protein